MSELNLKHRLLLPGVIVVVTLYLAITNYPTLPEQIPTHFNASGEPDGWGKTSFSSIFSLPLLQLTLYGIFSGLLYLFSTRQDIRPMINLPNRDQLTTEQVERIRRIIVNGMSGLNLVTCLMLFYIQFGTFQVVKGQWSGLGSFVWLFTLLIVGTAGWMLYQLFILRK